MKKSFLLAGFIASLALVPCVKAENLTENKTLDADTQITDTYVISSGKNITIDLKGKTLTGPQSGYAIDNQGGTLTITDSVGGGKIVCKASSASCIRNMSNESSNLTIQNVEISSPFITVKNESKATLKIEGATISASGTTGTVLNYGNASIKNSHILATGQKGKAIYSMGQTVGNPSTSIVNSTIEATGEESYAFKIIRSTEDEGNTSSTMDVTVNGGTIIGDYLEGEGADIKMSGSIIGPVETIKYMTNATLILNEDATMEETLEIANGSTVMIDLNGHTITGNIKNAGTLILTDESEDNKGTISGTITNAGDLTINGGNYSALPINEGEGTNLILNGGTYPESAIKDLTLPEGKELKKNADGTYSIVDKVVEETKEDVKNPDTSDKAYLYIATTIITTLGLSLVIRKKLANN